MPYKDIEKRRIHNREYQKRHYIKNKLYYKNKSREREIAIKKILDNLKSDLKCSRCGESDPVCLDFHHKNSNYKEVNVSQASHRGWSIKKIMEEINKCIVLCSNCHRKEHSNNKKSD
jgi:hypothetical protein